jgi:hypothetical protein
MSGIPSERDHGSRRLPNPGREKRINPFGQFLHIDRHVSRIVVLRIWESEVWCLPHRAS